MKRPTGFFIAGLLGVACFGPAPPCRAADEPPKKSAASQPAKKAQQDLDDQLLGELGEEPSDKKAGKSPAAKKPDAQDPDSKPAKQANSPLDDDLLKQLEGDDARPAASGEGPSAPAEEQGGAETGPIERLARKMRDVQQRLAKRNGNDETQQLEAAKSSKSSKS